MQRGTKKYALGLVFYTWAGGVVIGLAADGALAEVFGAGW